MRCMSDQLKLDQQICFQLYTGSRLMQRMYRVYFDQWGITYSQYLVLLLLWEKDRQTISELSDPLDLDSGTLSPLLRRMEANGFVTREHEQSDYRKVVVCLTTRGRRLKTKAQKMNDELNDMLGFDDADLAAVTRVLEKINPSAAI
ncbi:MarR family winged helix-turn-helix transcriptional regulator [Corynebacterium diphtheriae]|uniref:MarR family winged helix-turn-helix transcriptional regulator n=1 Tax=Corynebacterium diphtheriae TaxID=1717 RepID=UPI000245B8AB|nr:MarR family transcriptional regulator [Corynebacterium diphtheriae]AEX45401.1 MarR-family transcriptional regulator [Corynebacterium diphtheriae INCA 402]AEX47657.1 MarR-family transcriptional regulator [Corynebacterium diphtheriae BH8]AEX71093.1 MarR-family transcriptional regulator [Corynebacterium diphtheriae CDCE 8392]AEX75626.1 MarR-family transcriptional regulator [Corynebacterium diphtheriae HC02]AEX77827.1 MarR-family transcriptional regulator [Corynebacterium diphtheriae HC03]